MTPPKHNVAQSSQTASQPEQTAVQSGQIESAELPQTVMDAVKDIREHSSVERQREIDSALKREKNAPDIGSALMHAVSEHPKSTNLITDLAMIVGSQGLSATDVTNDLPTRGRQFPEHFNTPEDAQKFGAAMNLQNTAARQLRDAINLGVHAELSRTVMAAVNDIRDFSSADRQQEIDAALKGVKNAPDIGSALFDAVAEHPTNKKFKDDLLAIVGSQELAPEKRLAVTDVTNDIPAGPRPMVEKLNTPEDTMKYEANMRRQIEAERQLKDTINLSVSIAKPLATPVHSSVTPKKDSPDRP